MSWVVLLWTAMAALGSAQGEVSKRIDAIFAQWARPDTPGAAVAVVRDGRVAFQKGYGIANLEYGIPITPDTVFHVASVSKQFTAMALVLLEQDGKLSLEDDVRRHLPELPDYGQTITIRNLLQHTSGIRDQWQTLALAGWRLDDVITQQQILRMLFRQKELNFPPGREHLYSNGGYTLAAEIAKRASGKASLGDFCDERIFRPLGMSNTHFHEDHRRIVRNRAYSYSTTAKGLEASPLNYANVGATSLFTTAPDLVRWLDNFRHAKVGGRAGVERLQEQAVLADGRKVDYALGVSVGNYRGLKTVAHSGGDAGYRSHVVWFPDEQLGVAVVSNSGSFNAGQIANRVAEVFAGAKMTPEPAKPKPEERTYADAPAAKLEPYVGFYRLSAGLLFEIELKEGKLQAAPPGQPKIELRPVTGNRFYVPQPVNGELEFMAKPDGGMQVKLYQGASEVSGDRITMPKFDAAELPHYAGVYWSDELETQYTISVKDGKLAAGHPHHIEIALSPVGRDLFRGDSWFFQEVNFTRDASGNVTGMTAGGGRVRGVRFTRTSR